MFFFWMIFVTLMLPVEVRILPTYKVVSDLGMLNTYAGLTMPLIASATATFLFRQFFLTVPDELVEAARIDGAGPMRFFKDVLLPLSKTSIAALFVIQFIYGWNQYLWPLLMTTDEKMYPVVMGIKRMISRRRCRHRMEPGDGHRHAGHAAAGAGGDADAEVVRQGPRGHREVDASPPGGRPQRPGNSRIRGGCLSFRGSWVPFRPQRREDLRPGPKSVKVIHGVDAEITDGEFIVIVGPSGCGKSTLLRMVAGLEDITGGEIAHRRARRQPARTGRARHRDGVPELRAVPAHERVRQHGLRPEDRQGAQGRDRGAGAEGGQDPGTGPLLLERKPRQLSGGQRQRVAMGRAIVRQPAVFLFDEPLSNLDAKLRAQTRLEIQKLHRELGVTSLFVTHDQVEAMTLAQRMIVMNAGRIEQIGTPEQVYGKPATTFVAGFIGSPPMNLLAGQADGTRFTWAADADPALPAAARRAR
jgi:sn-glycerol 3-phosphate transport system ATP-binding protein